MYKRQHATTAERPDRDTERDTADKPPRPRLPTLIPFAHTPQDEDASAPDSTIESSGDQHVLPITLSDYVNLVRWTGEAVRHKSDGVLRPAPRSLSRLAANAAAWVAAQRDHRIAQGTALGRPDSLAQHAERQGKRWLAGQRWVRGVFAA